MNDKKRKPLNTAKYAVDNPVVAIGANIEQQEKNGQEAFVSSDVLPSRILHGGRREQLEAVGVKFGDHVEDDPFLIYPELQ